MWGLIFLFYAEPTFSGVASQSTQVVKAVLTGTLAPMVHAFTTSDAYFCILSWNKILWARGERCAKTQVEAGVRRSKGHQWDTNADYVILGAETGAIQTEWTREILPGIGGLW